MLIGKLLLNWLLRLTRPSRARQGRLLKNISKLESINIEKSNTFSIGLILLRMILLLNENEIKDINKYD